MSNQGTSTMNPEDSQECQMLPADTGLSRGRALKNLLTLGLSFVLIFTGYQGLTAIQSSVNSSGGLGTAGLAVTYASLVASSLTVTPLVIGRLGPKWTMVMALCGYLAYMCANLYPHWGTIIPASVLLGTCAAPLWASMSVYIMRLSRDYTRASGVIDEKGERRSVFFGVFYAMFTTSSLWGNMVSFMTLRDLRGHHALNKSAPISNLTCGYRFCSSAQPQAKDSQVDIGEQPMGKFYVMMGCFITTAALSILVMLLLVDRTILDSERRSFSLAQLRVNIRAMVAQMSDSRQLLLVILTVNIGFSQSFILVDFTEGFVACSSGIAAVGRVMMCYGVGQVVSGLVFGLVASKVGKVPVLFGASCVQLTLEALALFWPAEPEPFLHFYAFAVVWGCINSACCSQLNALYGDYFTNKTNTAFSVCRFLEAVGYIMGFSCNKLLCISQKLHILLVAVSTGSVALVASAFVNR